MSKKSLVPQMRKRPSFWVDADVVYRRLSDDLVSTLEESNADSMRAIAAAIRVADSLVTDEDRKHSRTSLKLLADQLREFEDHSRESARTLSEQYQKQRKDLLAQMELRLSGKNPDSLEAEQIRADYRLKLLELESQEESELAKALDNYSESVTSAIRDVTAELSELEAAQKERKDEYIQKLSDFEDQIEQALRENRKVFDATRKKRVKEKPELSEEEQMKQELNELDAGLFRRKILRPMLSSVKDRIVGTYQGFKKATGIQFVQDFIESERKRKDRIDELRFELGQKKIAARARAVIEDERKKLGITEGDLGKSNVSLSDSTSRLSSVVHNLEKLTQSAPALMAHPGSEGLHELLTSANSSPDITIDRYLQLNNRRVSSSITKSIQGLLQRIMKPRSSSRTLSPALSHALTPTSDYSEVQNRFIQEREVRALEALAHRKVGTSTASDSDSFFSLPNLLALGAGLAAVLAGKVKELLATGLLAEFLARIKNLAGLKDFLGSKIDQLGAWKDKTILALEDVLRSTRARLSTIGEALSGFKEQAIKAISEMPSKVSEFFETRYTTFKEWGKSFMESARESKLGKAVASGVESVKSFGSSAVGTVSSVWDKMANSNVVKSVSNGLTTARSAVTNALESGGEAVSAVRSGASQLAASTSEKVSAVGSRVSKAARVVGQSLSNAGSEIIEKGSQAFNYLSSGVSNSKIVDKIVSAAGKIAASPLGRILKKVSGYATVIDGAYQLFQEANGRPPTEFEMLDLLDPMKLGRMLGHKIDDTTQSLTGTRLSTYLSRVVESDAEVAAGRMMSSPASSTSITTVNQVKAPPSVTTSSSQNAPSTRQNVLRGPSGSTTVSSMPSSKPSLIPNSVVSDPTGFVFFSRAM